MAKIINQSIPPALAELWNKLHSPAKATQGGNGAVKAKNKVKAPTKKPRRNLDLIALQDLARLVAKIHFTDRALPIPQNFVFSLTQQLVVGVVPPEYFRQPPVESAITLQSTPTYINDPDPPPYGYRTENNLPTRPTYPDGTPTTGGAQYTGQKIGTRFADTLLKWRKVVVNSPYIYETGGEKKLLMKWNTRIDVASSSRGSRPMLGLHLKCALSTDTGGALSSTEPPLLKKTSFYWRFKMPPSAPPYFNTSIVRNEVRALPRLLKKTGTGVYTRYVMNAANRPMMGRGFNNNDNIQTSFNTDPELWEIKPPCRVYTLAQYNTWQWEENPDTLWTVTLTTSGFNVTAAGLGWITLNISMTDGINTHAFSITEWPPGMFKWYWDFAGGMGDGGLPRTFTTRVIDASCEGNKVLLHVRRSTLDYLHGARAFLLLTLTSPTSATLSTVADCVACNETYYTTESSDYGQYGVQVDHWYTNPKTIWCWFNGADAVEQVQIQEYSYSPYPWQTGYEEARILVDGAIKSTLRMDIIGPSGGPVSLDGVNDAGRLKSLQIKQTLRDKYKQLIQVNPNWNTRFITPSLLDYYADRAAYPNENYWPNAAATLEPVILTNKSLAFRLDVFRYIQAGSNPTPPVGYAPYYIHTDRYTGRTIRPGSVDGETTHEIIAP